MKSYSDAETLIACSPCAKAKARCDKRLPTCSRCLFKRQKCHPRQPRRYPEAFQLLNSTSQSPTIARSPSRSQSSYTTNIPSTTPGQNAFMPQYTLEPLNWPEESNTPNNPGTEVFSDEAAGTFSGQYDSLFSPSTIFPEPKELSLEYNLSNHSYDSHDHLSSSTMHTELPSPLRPGTILPSSNMSDQHGDKSDDGIDEDWPCFTCNPRGRRWIDPRIGGEHLMQLEKTLDGLPSWGNNLNPDITDPEVKVEKLDESVRDRLMVIAQGFFSRAREVRQAGLWEATLWRRSSMSQNNFTGLFILPSASVLESFLRIYSSRVETYMPFFPGKIISATHLLRANDTKVSVLLLLLMIAHGAMGSSFCEAHEFASGLIEICRICIFDVIEKNVQLAAHPVMMRCALLYMQASAWSGNKWHMDLSAAQLRSFTSMLKYSRLLDARHSSLQDAHSIHDAEAAWAIWCQEERVNRLIYGWVILDQEINLFYDRPLDLDVNEISAFLPANDALWKATSAERWLAIYLDLHMASEIRPENQKHGLSHTTLFRRFTNGELSRADSEVSQVELRLLLHPVQSLIYHLYKSFSHCFHTSSQRQLQRFLAQVEEIQHLLKQWYDVTQRSFRTDETLSSHECCNMVLYHLISLNALAHIPDIEKFARGEVSIEDFRESVWMGKRYSEDATLIWCHGGQILRLIQKLAMSSRPYWWCASIYRAALYMWVAGVAIQQTRQSDAIRTGTEYVTVDALPFHHPLITRCMRHRDGIPTVSRAETATAIVHDPGDILRHCIIMLEEDQSISALAKSIKSRLEGLHRRVSLESR